MNIFSVRRTSAISTFLQALLDQGQWVVESFEANDKLRYVGVSLGNRTIVSAVTGERFASVWHDCWAEDVACSICSPVIPAVRKPIELSRRRTSEAWRALGITSGPAVLILSAVREEAFETGPYVSPAEKPR